MKKSLSTKETILVASTLFGMFFGAGNLIFPVHMGQLAGANVWPAIIGFIITGVTIPILGVAAIGVTHSDGLLELSENVGRKYSYIFTVVLYLTIGPFFAIPRCATTSFTTGVSALLPGANEKLALLIFSAVFFAIVLIFSLKPTKIMVWVGKIINPAFLVFLIVLVIAALKNPAASIASVEPVESYSTGAFFNGFIEGYGTMDAIAGLAFGIVVVNVIRGLGVCEPESIAKCTLKSGIVTGIMMAVIYVLTTIMGTESRGLFEVSDNGGIALAQISGHFLGAVGSAVLALTVTFACLKTSIGLVTSCGEMFITMTNKGLSYRQWAVIITVFSFIVSNVGLTALITYAVPVLMLLYPLAMVLIVLSFLDKFFGGAQCVYVCTTIGAFIAAIFDFIKTLPFGIDVSFAAKFLPLFDLGLGWIVPAAIGFVVGMLLRKKYPNRATKVQRVRNNELI